MDSNNKVNSLQNVTNQEFLEGVFGAEWEMAHVTSFTNDPSNIPQQFRGACWGGGYARDRLGRMSAGENQYFTLSLFKSDNQGRAVRQKALFDATYVIVADDVKEKIDPAKAALLPPPSYVLQTSQDSFHWGWILEHPCDVRSQVENLVDGWVKQGLCSEGVDPGMRGVTRYMRLPEGSNTKAKRLNGNGEAFKCMLLEWNPDRLYDMEDLAAPFGIDLTDSRGDDSSQGVAAIPDGDLRHPILDVVNVTGYGSDNWVRIDCPNGDKHTGGDLSGAAFQVQSDGRINFECHHGHCEKMTGPKIVSLLDEKHEGFAKRYYRYQEEIKVRGKQMLIAAHTRLMGTEDDIDALLGTDGDKPSALQKEMNPTDYVYLKPSGSYYELATGTEMSAKALDAYWRGQHSGAKGDPVASRLFDLAKDHATMTADGFLWQPDQLQPTSPRVIRKEGRQEINEWRGLALSPIKGDVTLWLDLLAFLVPDERERRCVVQWMANLFLDIGRKPSWQIIHRGSLRNGKDSLYKPLAQIFGPRSAGDVRPTDVDAGWGDSFYGKKFLIFQEIYRPQDKSFSNLLKTFAAPTATGVREFNMKGKGIRSQVDCSGFVGMSNYRACLAVDRGDERYFVIDSFFAPLPTEFYTEYHAWLDSGGAGAVLYYLLNDVDMSDFSAGKLPFVTEGASELMSLARPDYEQAMEDLIAESKGVFALPVFTAAQAKEYLITQGHKMGRNGLTEALGLHGYAQHRGTKKVDGKVCNTPAFFTREDLSRRRPKEIYDYYVAAKDRGAGLARLMEKS